MGYVLLEAPREYVLHGPLLSIYWLGLCPHLGGPRPKPRHPEEVVYSLNDSCSHLTQRLFPPKVPQQHTETIPMVHNNIIHTYYTSHSYAHLHLLFLHVLFKTSFLQIFMAGWLPLAPCVQYNNCSNEQEVIIFLHCAKALCDNANFNIALSLYRCYARRRQLLFWNT